MTAPTRALGGYCRPSRYGEKPPEALGHGLVCHAPPAQITNSGGRTKVELDEAKQRELDDLLAAFADQLKASPAEENASVTLAYTHGVHRAYQTCCGCSR